MQRNLCIALGIGVWLAAAACGDDTPAAVAHDCGYWSGPDFTDEWICYEIVGDNAVSGDIILGPHAELQRRNDEIESGQRNAIKGRSYYWPDGRVPYTIADDVPMDLKLVIADAAREYNDYTIVRWVPRSNLDNDYVEFVMATAGADFGGAAALGHRGGRQTIELNPSLSGNDSARNAVRHEMGHTIGLVHEQQRHDASNYIDVHWDRIAESWHAQYQPVDYAVDVLEYDFWSIMHYPMLSNGVWRMTAKAGVALGHPSAVGFGRQLSPGDFADIRYLYSVWVVPWVSMGNSDVRKLDVEVNKDGRLELFALRDDGSLWHRWQTAPRSDWGDWALLGTPNREMAVDANKDGRIEVFSVDGDQVWHRWQDKPGQAFVGWQGLGDPLPGVAQLETAINRDGRLEVFARRNNGEIWHIWQHGNAPGGWSSWELFAAVNATDIAATENKDGRIEVAYVGTAGAVGHLWQEFKGTLGTSIEWQGPQEFGHDPSKAVKDVEIVRNQDGHLEVFAALVAGGIEHAWQTSSGWSAWESFRAGGAVTNMAFGINDDGRLEAFAVVAGKVEHRSQTKASKGPWSDWTTLVGTTAGITAIAVGRNEEQVWTDDAYLELFASRSGVVYHTWQKGIGLRGKGNSGLGSDCPILTDTPSCNESDGDVGESDGSLDTGDGSASDGETPTSGGWTSGDPTRGDPSGDPTSGGASGDPTSDDPTSGDTSESDSTTGGSMSGGSMSGGSMSGGSMSGGSMSGGSISDGTTGDDGDTTGGTDATGGDDWLVPIDVGAATPD